jgi:hypothetical protein
MRLFTGCGPLDVLSFGVRLNGDLSANALLPSSFPIPLRRCSVVEGLVRLLVAIEVEVVPEGFLGLPAVHRYGHAHQLLLPSRHLARMNPELACQLGRCPIALGSHQGTWACNTAPHTRCFPAIILVLIECPPPGKIHLIRPPEKWSPPQVSARESAFKNCKRRTRRPWKKPLVALPTNAGDQQPTNAT